jgi:hypothetical protein
VLRVYLQSGLLPGYYGADRDKEAHRLGLHGVLFLRATTDEDDFQVVVVPYSSTEPELMEAVPPGASPWMDQQQHMIHPFLPQDTLLSSPDAVSVPVGLSSKELAQLRAMENAPRLESPDRRLSDFSSAATTDRGALGGMAAEATPLPDAQRLWSEFDLLRHEVQQLRAERSESEEPPTYVSEAG